jgi:hypothetical protein
VSVSLCSQILPHQHTSRSLYPPPVEFSSLESNQKEHKPSLSTQRTSTTSTSSSSTSTSSTCGSPSRHRRDLCSMADWLVFTRMNTTKDEFHDLLTSLTNYDLKPYNVQSDPVLGFQLFMVKMNTSLASKIQQHPTVS